MAEFFQSVHELFSRTEHILDYIFKKTINIKGLNFFKGCSLTTVIINYKIIEENFQVHLFRN